MLLRDPWIIRSVELTLLLALIVGKSGQAANCLLTLQSTSSAVLSCCSWSRLSQAPPSRVTARTVALASPSQAAGSSTVQEDSALAAARDIPPLKLIT